MKKFVLIAAVLIAGSSIFAEDLSLVTVNAWPGLNYRGFIRCGEYETGEVRLFRGEVLISGLKELDPDIAVINGLNPAGVLAADAGSELDMYHDSWVSRSGLRIGPVSLPLNLQEGDAFLADRRFSPEFAGRKILGGGISNRTFTIFSRNSSQIICSRINTPDGEVYVYTAVWRESAFSDRESLANMMESYLKGEITPEEYSEMIADAVSGTAEREAQAEETLAFINSTAGKAPVILMGSLNALPGSSEITLLKEAGFTDVYEAAGKGRGYTWDSSVNSNIGRIDHPAVSGKYRTDYILIRGPGLKPVSAEIVFNKPVYGVYASARFGVKAVVRLTKIPSGQ